MTSYKPLQFPSNFKWGVATAAHQNEGNNKNNDFWQWEQLPGKVHDGTTSALATDWWDADHHRAEADFDRAAEMGLTTIRLSLEWSRIEPEENRWDDAAIDRYRTMLAHVRQRGLTPMVTLHHFTNPRWLAEQGGWLHPDAVACFQRYTKYAVKQLGDLCEFWCTINEPMVYAYLAYLTGLWSPGEHSFPHTFQVAATMVNAHWAATQTIHKMQSQARVGLAKHIPVFDPLHPNRLDKLVANTQDTLFNERLCTAVYNHQLKFPLTILRKNSHFSKGNDDFIGINYYGRHSVTFDLRQPFALFGRTVARPNAEMWQAPWADREVYPSGLSRVIKRMASYGKPIYITENGIDDREDHRRARFLLTHLAAVHRAIQHGVDVRGYYHWTLVDNYEWVEGWSTRFGLIGLDPKTQARTPRRSAALYSAIAKANAITPEMVEAYAPEAMDAVFAQP